jgi:hypothetical protein
MSTFKDGRKKGYYWESLLKIKEIVDRLSLDMNYNTEKEFEDRIAGALQPNFDDFIDQRNTKQTMTRVTLFDHDHRPDLSIGEDGIAIEVKLAKSGESFRSAIGQSLIYRMGYRFSLVIWIDTSKNKRYVNSVKDKKHKEKEFLLALEQQNIFSIIK